MRGLPKRADSTAVRNCGFCLVAGLFLGLTNDGRAADGGYIAVEQQRGMGWRENTRVHVHFQARKGGWALTGNDVITVAGEPRSGTTPTPTNTETVDLCIIT